MYLSIENAAKKLSVIFFNNKSKLIEKNSEMSIFRFNCKR